MVEEKTFVTPAGIFFITMVVVFVTTAALHPQEFGLVVYGLMYFLCIPSGYLLLTIYSMVNMNNVTWGTRESGGPAKTPVAALQGQVMQAKLCSCCGSPPGESQPTAEAEMQDLEVRCDSRQEER